jgi:hypothetical protein
MYAVPNMAVVCSFFISCFLGRLLTYFLSDFEMVPIAPVISGITLLLLLLLLSSSSSSSVGIATRYVLDGQWIEFLWGWGGGVGARFSAPVQTGPGAHPASCTMSTGSFLGVKRLGRGAEHPPPSSAEVKERIELFLYSPTGPLWPVVG